MFKFSQEHRGNCKSALAFAAIALLAATALDPSAASARGFGGGGHSFAGGFGVHAFSGGGFGGHAFGSAVASRSLGGGFAGHNVGGHVGAGNRNQNQTVGPRTLGNITVGHTVLPRLPSPANRHPAPNVPTVPEAPEAGVHGNSPSSGHNNPPAPAGPAPLPNGGLRQPPQPAKPTPPGLIQPPSGGIHVPPPLSGVRPGKPLPPGIGPLPPPSLHVLPGHPLPTLPPPRLAQPIEPPAPVNPAPVSPPSQHGGPDTGYTGPTIAVGVTGEDAVIEAPLINAGLSGPTCNRILSNGCYFAMRKFSTSNGPELRCTMICE